MKHTVVRSRPFVNLSMLVAVVLFAVSCTNSTRSSTDDRAGAGSGLVVSVVAGRAEYVSGPTVRVGIVATSGNADSLDPKTVKITVDDAGRAGDAPAAEAVKSDSFEGVTALIDGLTPGTHVIGATSGSLRGELEIEVGDEQGPLFSGPHLYPLACMTEANGLDPSTDEDCEVKGSITWRAVGTDGKVTTIGSPDEAPADTAKATVDGRQVPFIVRTESGVINRAVYWISYLEDAGRPVTNNRLLYQFGGGCGASFGQGTPLTGGTPALDPALIESGYVMATSTFNTFQVACNDVLSAETTLMVKERVGELVGPIDLTIGEGASGGAIQQLLIAQNYPGLLDAVVAAMPFPDHFSIAPGVVDCGLLTDYFAGKGATLTAAQKTAITGFATYETCESWRSLFYDNVDPSKGCAKSIPPDAVYSTDNPDGVRCTMTDSNVNILGRDPGTGFARRPLDNVGVEYGRSALMDGTISVDDFLNLNEFIGGIDIDGQHQNERHEADPKEIESVVADGRVNSGGGDLTRIPVFLANAYSDPSGDIHDRQRMFAVQERLKKAGGTAGLSLVTLGGGSIMETLTGGGKGILADLTKRTDDWATALLAKDGWKVGEDSEHAPEASTETVQKWLAETRPAEARSTCATPTGEIEGPDAEAADGPCAEAFPVHGDPRIAAGGPTSGDVGKCALRPVDAAEYGVPFTDEQVDRLARVFAGGVCDWAKSERTTGEFTSPWKAYGS